MLPVIYPPYPDELLFSFVSRHFMFAPFKKSQFLEEILDGKCNISLHYFQRIERLSKNLPHGIEFEVDTMLKNNTYLPLLKPFIDEVRYESAKEALLGVSYGIQKKVMLDVENLFNKDKSEIKICPICFIEDKKDFGESYIHRIHNYLGAKTCHLHGCYLDSISVYSDNASTFIDINDSSVYCEKPIRYPEKDLSIHYENLNEDVHLILNGAMNNISKEVIQQKFQEKCLLLGNYTSKLSISNPVIIGFKEYFSSEFLVSMESNFEIEDENIWIRKVLYQTKAIVNPIRVILLIRYLFGGVQSLVDFNKEFRPFNEPTFPCLNTVCPRYREDVIMDNIYTLSNNKKAITGTFKCPECGFTYTRNTKHKDALDKYSYSYLKDRGYLWKDSLISLIDENLSLKELGRRLNADPKEIKRHLLSLGYEEWLATKTIKSKTKIYTGRKLKEVDISEYKNQISEYIIQHPEATRTSIRASMSKAIYNLRKYDSEWLLVNLPAQVKVSKWDDSKYTGEFWLKRENELVLLYKDAIEQILNSNEPIRITWSTLKRRTNTFGLQPDKYLDKLPNLKKLVEDSHESNINYKIRIEN
jgi:transposase-like protein